MRWRTALHYALMWAIRYAPAPWALKHWAIRLASPHTLVVGAALIPDDAGRILMLQARYSGHWITPGGALHPGEDPLTGTRRECREELGCEVAVEALAGLYAMALTGELYVGFRCAPLAGPPRLSAEHRAFRYVPRAELPWRVRLMAEDAWGNDPRTPAVRTLDGGAAAHAGDETRLDAGAGG